MDKLRWTTEALVGVSAWLAVFALAARWSLAAMRRQAEDAVALERRELWCEMSAGGRGRRPAGSVHDGSGGEA